MDQPTRYDLTVIDFFGKRKGVLVAVSDDPQFFKRMRSALGKTLGIDWERIIQYPDTSSAMQEIKLRLKQNEPVLLCSERVIGSRPCNDFVVFMKKNHPGIRILVLTAETYKENLAMLYELGVDNILTKPCSINNFVEKVAFALEPQTKLGRLIQEGKECVAKGEHARAMEVAAEVLELKPGSPAGHMLTGDALLVRGDRAGAVQQYEKAHANSRSYLEPMKKLAELYREQDVEQHLHYLKKLDKLSPLNTERKCDIGVGYVRKKEFETADRYFEQAMDTAAKQVMGVLSSVAGSIAARVSEMSPRLAEKYYAKALEAKGDKLSRADMVTFNQLGIALRRQGKWQQAIENYRKALGIAEDDEGLHYNMGLAFSAGNRFAEARKSFERALALRPNLFQAGPEVCLHLARVYLRTKDPGQAAHFARKALDMDPGDPEAKKILQDTSK